MVRGYQNLGVCRRCLLFALLSHAQRASRSAPADPARLRLLCFGILWQSENRENEIVHGPEIPGEIAVGIQIVFDRECWSDAHPNLHSWPPLLT